MEPTLKNIMLYFGMTPGEFSREWNNKSGDPAKTLTQEDKDQIKAGMASETWTY